MDDEVGSVTRELTQMRDQAKGAAKGSRELGDDVESSGKKVGTFRERLKGLNPLLGKVGKGLKTAALAVTGFVAAAGASAATLSIFSKNQAKLADELTNTSNAIGVNREQLQLWRIAGDRVGLSGEKVADILRNVTERLGEFSRTGGGEAADVMDTLNLKIEEFRNLSPDEQMLKLGQAIGEIGSKSEQVALLEKLASDASQLQPLLEDNAAGLRAIFDQAQQEGAIYSEEELNKLTRANDIYNDIDLKIRGLTARIGAELAPVVADATDKVVGLFEQNEAGEKLIGMFKSLIAWGSDMATHLVSNADSITAGFDTLWKTIKSLTSGATAAFRFLQTAVSAFVTGMSVGFSGLMSAAQGLTFVLNKIGVVSDEAYNSIKAKAEAARAVTVDLANKTADYAEKAEEAGKGVVDAFDSAEKKLEETSDQAKKTGDDLLGLGDKAEQAGEKTEKSADKVADLEDAYKGLGVTSQAELEKAANEAEKHFQAIKDSSEATERELKQSFQAYAQAIIATGDKARIKTLETEAASLDLSEALKEVKGQAEAAGEAGKKAGETIQESFQKAIKSASDEKALKQLHIQLLAAASAGKDVGDELQEVQQRLKEIQQLQDGGGPIEEVGEDADDAGDSAEEAGEKFTSSFGDFFSATMTNARESVSALSVAARNLFERKIGGNQIAKDAGTAKEALDKVNQQLGAVSKSIHRVRTDSWTVTGSGFTRWALETKQASLEAQQAFYQQAAATEELREKIDAGSYSMAELNRLSQTASRNFSLLDDQRLNGLQQAIDNARSKIDSLNSSAESTLNSLSQRLADISGDTEEAQRLQYEAEKKRLQEREAQARDAGAEAAAADYAQALEQLEKIYQIEQRNRREEQNEREKAAADRAREQELAELERQRSQREPNQTNTTQQQSNPSRTIVLQGPGGGQASVQVTGDQEGDLLDVLEDLGYRSNGV